MKKLIALLLALALLLSLCACGGKEEEKPDYLGKYISVKGEMLGMSLTGDEISGFDIELKEKGKGTMTVEGESANITYEVNGTDITIKVEGEEIAGVLGKDTITVEDMLGLGLTLTFAKEGTAAADPANYQDASSQSEPEAEPSPLPDSAPVDAASAEMPEIAGGVRYDCFAFNQDNEMYKTDGTYLVLGDSEAALALGGRTVLTYTVVHAGTAVIFQGVGDADGAAATVDGDVLLMVMDDNTVYYLLKEGGKTSENYAFLADPANLKDPPNGAAPAAKPEEKPAESKPEEKPAESKPEEKPAASGSAYGKSVEGADGVVPAAKIMEAAMIVRGGFQANYFFSYEEIYELMGGVHGEPDRNHWDDETRTHYYKWYPDNDHDDFFGAQFVVVGGAEMGKTYQYPGDVYDTDGTPYEKKPAKDTVGKSKEGADGMTSKEGLAAFVKQRQDQKSKQQGIEMTYEQVRDLCGCDGKPALVDSWKADRHKYTWRVDDDIYYTAEFAVLSTGDEIYVSGSGPSDLEGKLGIN